MRIRYWCSDVCSSDLATWRHAFDDAEFDGWLAAGDRRADFFGKIVATARRYNTKHDRGGLVAADALAMAVALDPSIVTRSERRAVAVELDGRLTRGAPERQKDGWGKRA